MCEIENFHLLFEGRVFIFPSVNLQKWNPSWLYFLTRSMKRWRDDMKVFSFLLSDFNFLLAKSIPSPFCCMGRFCSTHVCPSSFSLFNASWDGSRMQIPNRPDWWQPGFNKDNQANAVFFSPPPERLSTIFHCIAMWNFPAKLGSLPPFFQSISIWFVICDLYWCDTLQGSPRPTPPPTHSPAPLLWANLSDLSHPRAFSGVCPQLNPFWLSISIWHPRRVGGRVWKAPHFDRKTSV